MTVTSSSDKRADLSRGEHKGNSPQLDGKVHSRVSHPTSPTALALPGDSQVGNQSWEVSIPCGSVLAVGGRIPGGQPDGSSASAAGGVQDLSPGRAWGDTSLQADMTCAVALLLFVPHTVFLSMP